MGPDGWCCRTSSGRRWSRWSRRVDRRGRPRHVICGARSKRSSGAIRTARDGERSRPSMAPGGGQPSCSSAGPSSGHGSSCWKRRRSVASSSAWRSSMGPASGRTTRRRGRPNREGPAGNAPGVRRSAAHGAGSAPRRASLPTGAVAFARPGARAAAGLGVARPPAEGAALGRGRPRL
jgi:hypothetical protein